MSRLTKPSAQTPVGMLRHSAPGVDVSGVILRTPSSSPPLSSALVLGVEDALGIAVEPRPLRSRPLGSLGGPCGAIEIQLADLVEPARELLQVEIVFLELGVAEVARRRFPGDLA